MRIRKEAGIWAAALMLFMAMTPILWAEPHLKSIKVAITNPTDENRPAENIVLSIPELKKIAPDFYAGSQIVTASDASTIDEDSTVLHPTEVPSQVEDVDGEGVPDELAFQIDLKPHQTRIVTVTWGPCESYLSFARRLRKTDGCGLYQEDRWCRMGIETQRISALF